MHKIGPMAAERTILPGVVEMSRTRHRPGDRAFDPKLAAAPRPAARRCATTATPTANSAISSTASASITARASHVSPRRGGETDRAERAIDVLLSSVPEVILGGFRSV